MQHEVIHINVNLDQYYSHIFNVAITMPHAQKQQRFSLPLWTPGSYMIREFAQHIVSIKAFCGEKEVAIKKIDKNTFEVANTTPHVSVQYQVYGFDSSIRAAFIDNQQAFFNGAALFLRPHGYEQNRYFLTVHANDFAWEVASSMPRVEVDERGFGTYEAHDYQALIDYPFQISAMKRLKFMVESHPHEMVLVGDVRPFDEDRLVHDMRLLCAEHIKLFGQAPFKEYVFIARFEEGGYGGLEHRNSTMLLSAPNVLPKVGMKEPDAAYRDFLALCSHEYFHAWNIKAIKPKSFVPYDLDHEVYTEMLWIFEGITSYYDDLLVFRAGLISEASYYDILAKNLTRLKRNSGRFVQSLRDASFDAWIKFYRPNENSLNATTSYYLKGSIVALYLDFVIHKESAGKISLDDVMRQVFERFGDGRGIRENEWYNVLENLTGVDIEAFDRQFISGLVDLPVAELFEHFGLLLSHEPDEWYADDKTRARAYLGFKMRFDDNQRALITYVDCHGPAAKAGLSPNDEIIALQGIRIDCTNWPEILGSIMPNQTIQCLAVRKKKLFDVTIAAHILPLLQCRIAKKEENHMLRDCWLRKTNHTKMSASLQ